MKEFYARLNSTERRFLIVVLIVIFFVINLIFVWPRFKDWDELQGRMAKAEDTLSKRKTIIAQSDALKPRLAELEKQDVNVPQEDQVNEFLRTITSQAAQSRVEILANASIRSTATTNQFFTEQAQAVNVKANEAQLVDFLYRLGAGNSLIRVRDLTLNPELPNRYALRADLRLVASFQKKTAVRTVTAAPTNAPAAKPAPAPAVKPATAAGRPPTPNPPTKK